MNDRVNERMNEMRNEQIDTWAIYSPSRGCFILPFVFHNCAQTMDDTSRDDDTPTSNEQNGVDALEDRSINIMKWCQISQEKALLNEARTERFGITRSERKFLRGILGYDKKEGDQRKKNYEESGLFTRAALGLMKIGGSEGKVEEEEEEEEEEEKEKEEEAVGRDVQFPSTPEPPHTLKHSQKVFFQNASFPTF